MNNALVSALVRCIVALVSLCSVSAFGAGAAPEAWQTYRNDQYDFSFSYPSSLHLTVRAQAWKETSATVLKVTLRSDNPEELPILYISVDQPKGLMQAHWDRNSLRRGCDKSEDLQVGNRRGVSCVICGRGACHWSANVLGPTMFGIGSQAWEQYVMNTHVFTENSMKELVDVSVPKNDPYPIWDIIQTFKFGSSVPN